MNDLLSHPPEAYEFLRRIHNRGNDAEMEDPWYANITDPFPGDGDILPPQDPEVEGWHAYCLTTGLTYWAVLPVVGLEELEIQGEALCLTAQGKAALLMWERSQHAPHQPDAKVATPASAATTGKRLTLDMRAVILYIGDKTLTKKDIAGRLGVQTQSLAPERCPQLDLLMKGYKEVNANDRRMTKGSKGKDGTLEAYVEDE